MSTRDFRATQVRTHAIIGSGSSPQLLLYPSASATNQYGGVNLPGTGSDAWMFVSGAIGTTTGKVVFGGDTNISGTLKIGGGSSSFLSGTGDFTIFYGDAGGSHELYIRHASQASSKPAAAFWGPGSSYTLELSGGLYVNSLKDPGSSGFRVDNQDSGVMVNVDTFNNRMFLSASQVTVGKGSVHGGADVNFFVSGTAGSRGTSVRGTSVFAGDVMVSGTFVTTGITGSNLSISGDTTIGGNLTVNGTTTTVNTTNLVVRDPIVLIGSGAVGTNRNGGIAIASGSSTAGQALVFGRIANNTWGAGKLDVTNGTVTTLAAMDLVNVRAGRFELGGTTSFVSSSGASNENLVLQGTAVHVTGTLKSLNGISGSHTSLTDGRSFLVAGANVTVTSASDGQITIASSAESYFSSTTAGSIFTTGSAAFRGGESGVDSPSDKGADVFFYVSGTIDSSATSKRALFGGGVVISGSLNQGLSNTADGNYSHAQGDSNTASGLASHAEGELTIASGIASHAENYGSTASGNYSHAEGSGTTASGGGAHAEGQSTQALGSYSHAEGSLTLASGEVSHAEGSLTLASGDFSHAEGSSTQALGSYSHAEGGGSIAGARFVYIGSNITNGVITVDASHGDITSGYTNLPSSIFINDQEYGGHSGLATAASFDGTNSYITSSLGTLSLLSDDPRLYDISNLIISGTLTGGASHAEGDSSRAAGPYSHAEGQAAGSYGNHSHAEGYSNFAIGNYSHAEGFGTSARGVASHTDGEFTIAVGQASHAGGYYTIASGSRQTVVGKYNQRGNTSSLFVVGDGSGDSDGSRHDVFRVNSGSVDVTGSLWVSNGISGSHTTLADGRSFLVAGTNVTIVSASDGQITISSTGGGGDSFFSSTTAGSIFTTGSAAFKGAEGIDSPADKGADVFFYVSGSISGSAGNSRVSLFGGDVVVSGSFTQGLFNTTSGLSAHAQGNNTTASGSYSHAEGGGSLATGDYSHAEGSATITSGIGSHAEGSTTTASGDYSHAEGYGTDALGDYSHAEGYETVASSAGDHAEGYQTTAAGSYSHAEGYQTIAAGSYSHAEGESTIAVGVGSHAGGIYTIASGSGQTVYGKYNLRGNTSSLLVIGNGIDDPDINRSDVLRVETTGLQVTGSGWFSNGISGSHTSLADGRSFLVAGANVTVTSASDGQITIASTGGGGDSFFSSTTAGSIFTTGSAAFKGAEGIDSPTDKGADVFFYVSGTRGGPLSSSKKALFGGDVVVSGSLIIGGSSNGNLSGSGDFNVYFGSSGIDNELYIRHVSQTPGRPVAAFYGGPGGPAYSLELSGGLYVNSQRTLDAEFRFDDKDGGAMASFDAFNKRLFLSASQVTINRNSVHGGTDVNFFVSGVVGSRGTGNRGTSVFSGDVVTSGSLSVRSGISGSHTTLADGRSFLVAGTNVTIVSASDGQITISSTGGGGGGDSFFSSTTAGSIFTTGSAAFSGAESIDSPLDKGADVFFYVSGAIGSRGTSTVGTSVFGGDVVISGTLFGGSPLKVGTDLQVTGTLSLSSESRFTATAIQLSGSSGVTGSLVIQNDITSESQLVLSSSTGFSTLNQTSVGDLEVRNTKLGGNMTLGVKTSAGNAVNFMTVRPNGAAVSTLVSILPSIYAGPANPVNSTDTNFFVGGTVGSRGGANRGTAVFGGDLVISGTVYTPTGMSVTGSITIQGDILPDGDRVQNLGSPTKRWAHVYTGDLHLRNERGDYTLIEEEEFLSIRFNKTGKRYRFLLEPVPHLDEDPNSLS